MSQTVQYHSLGDNLAESIKGFLIGIVLFIAAFPVLWWNEGRTDMSEVAKTAIVVKADSPGTAGEGKLVSATADLKVDETVGDPEMTLVPGQYAHLHRKAEMFAWVEKKDSRTEKKAGGSSKTITTYTYPQEWTDSPKSADTFHDPVGHTNPSLTVHSEDFYPAHVKVGAFSFSPKECELPPATKLALTPALLKLPPAGAATPAPTPAAAPATKTPPGHTPPKGKGAPPAAPPSAPAPDAAPATGANAFRLLGDVLYRGHGTSDTPKVGDVRVSFETVLPGTKVTLFGKRQGTTVVAFVNGDSDKLFRAVLGTHEEAIARLHGEHVMMTWILRLVGFLFMWIGLGLFLAPVNAVLDIVPFVGSAGRFVTSIAMFPVALILSVVTILISIVAHSWILLLLTFVLFAGGLTALILFKRKKVPAGAAPPGGMPPTGYGGPPQQGYGGPPQGGYGPPPGGGGYGPPPGGGGYGPPPGGGGYGPPPGGGGGPPPGGGYGPPPGGG